jgi:hypothetical protein
MSLHATVSTPLLSPGNDLAQLTPEQESKLRSPTMPALPYLISPTSSPSPKPQNTRSPRKRKSSRIWESDSPPPFRHAVDTRPLKGQHTTWSGSTTAQIITIRLLRFVIAFLVYALSTRTTCAARTYRRVCVPCRLQRSLIRYLFLSPPSSPPPHSLLPPSLPHCN